jgi:nitrite reductase/ring-hydroxylating ferredoxin subunit
MSDGTGEWTRVASASEVPNRSIKRVVVGAQEVAIVNLDGTFYAVVDRCGHMNAPFSRGSVRPAEGTAVLTCPLHGSTFDAASGKNLTGPVKPPAIDMTGTPRAVLDTLARAAELSALIRVKDVATFPVRQVGDDLQLKV